MGRAPEPREWPPANLEGRYSHPDGAVRVLYGATERIAAFLETLQTYRPSLADLAMLQAQTAGTSDFPGAAAVGIIPDSYFRRRIGTFRVNAAEPIVDLCLPETHAHLRRELAGELLAAGYTGSFNFGEVIGTVYRLTQSITRWAHARGFTGIAYPSAHDHALTCWAVFDTAEITLVGDSEAIRRDDPALLAAASLFGLTL
ncbi:MAG: RES family NAD+ phosphorylase [Thermomicrobiales bacterium]